MMTDRVVSDTSALIALHQIGQLTLLAQVFSTVLVPSAGIAELRSLPVPPWLVQQSVAQAILPEIIQAGLGAGESEAISLALEVGAQLIILDDARARKLALRLGLVVTGTAGVLLRAKRQGHLLAVRPHLDKLQTTTFYLKPAVYHRVLVDAGEDT